MAKRDERIEKLERENAGLRRQLDESLAPQAASAEVLQVINSSPGDLAPVFDAILEKAHSLCGVDYGALQLYDGEKFHAGATRGYPEGLRELLRQPYALEPTSPLQSLLQGAPLVEIPDVVEHQADAPNPRAEAAITVGIRSVLFLPLRKDNLLLGLISAGRKEAGQFSEKQIALLQNFAAQAVIAMENARLITETCEALEQQTATAEVLQVINSSPGDLAPVFDAMLERALRVSESALGFIATYDGEHFRMAAGRGLPPAFAEIASKPYRPPPGSPTQRLINGESFVQIADLRRMDHPIGRANVEAGVLALLVVALRKDGALLGTISIARREPRPVHDKEIALLESFAAQAVI